VCVCGVNFNGYLGGCVWGSACVSVVFMSNALWVTMCVVRGRGGGCQLCEYFVLSFCIPHTLT